MGRRIAVITGGASGIGAAFGRMLAAEGAEVVLADAAQTVVETARTIGAEPVVADVRRPQVLADAVGDRPVDVLVHCAGIATETVLADVDDETFVRTLEVNLLGALRTTRALLPGLRRSAAGRILSVTSIHAGRAAPDVLAYGISKAGLEQATRALAVELAPAGILVNALAPGFVATPMARLADGRMEHEVEEFQRVYVEGGRLPLRRSAMPDEVAAAGEFLVSTRNTYVTGAVLAVDGGLAATF